MWWEKTASVFIVRGKRVPYYCVLMQLLQQQQQQHKRKTLVSFKVLDLVPLNPVVHFWDHLAKFSKSTSKTVIASALLCATHSLPNKSLALQNLTSTPDSSARDTHMPRPRSKSILLSLPNKTQSQTNAQWKIVKYKTILIAYMHVWFSQWDTGLRMRVTLINWVWMRQHVRVTWTGCYIFLGMGYLALWLKFDTCTK